MRTPHPDVVRPMESFAAPFSVCWVLLFLICPVVCSQTDLQASLSGKVTAQQSARPLAGVAVDLCDESGVKIAEAVTTSDGSFLFPAIPQGRHQLRVSLSGFQDYTVVVMLSAGKQSTVDVVLKLKQISETVEVVAQAPNEIPTTAVAAATLSARTVDVEPVKGDDYQSLLPLVPGVVRGPDGRININGSGAIQSGLTVSSSNVADPSTGNPGFELPMDAVESVSVLPNPYSPEYGRFSSGITQIQTRKGESRWGFLVNSIIPRLKYRDGSIMGIERFAPRLAAGGPLIRDRLFLSQSFQYRFIKTPVPALPQLQRDQKLESFDSFTRLDANLSEHHQLQTTFAIFPRKLDFVNLNTFNPMEVAADIHQRGYQIGFQETAVPDSSTVLETTVTYRRYDADVFGQGLEPMRIYPQGNRGNYFDRQDRNTSTVEWIETFSRMLAGFKGQHLIKAGLNLMSSGFQGTSDSGPVEVYRTDFTINTRIEYSGGALQDFRATNFGTYLQDHWRFSDRLAFEFGGRLDYDAVPGRTNLSPRAGAVISILPQARGVLRGGAGLFYEQTPLNVAAFETYESQTVTRFDAGGLTPLGPPATWQHKTSPGLKTPSSFIWNVEYDQKLTAAWMLRVNQLRRRGEHAYLIDPIRSSTAAEYLLDSRGRSHYWELELSLNYVRSDRFQMNLSYVRSHSETDLNSYDLFFGNLRNPIICSNQYSLAPADVPHRFIFHAVLPIPFKFTFAPMFEIRTGFPYSAIDEYQQFVGQRNRAGRFPTLATLDLRVTRSFKIWRWTVEAGGRVYHVLNSFSPRDVQSNVDAPDFGTFYNTIPRNFALTMQFRK